MDAKIFYRFRERLLQQKENLTTWFQNTPANKKRIRYGPVGENGVQAHLKALDDTLKKVDDRTIGHCQICHGYVGTGYLEMDYTASVCLDHFSDEQKRRLELDLELAHHMQRALLPHHVPEIDGLEVAAFTQPAEIVGGDYFDCFQFRDGSHGVAVADVMGKGMAASMLMASLQAALRIFVPENESPAAVAHRLNDLFCHNVHVTKFITLFLGRFYDNKRALEYCNAGHNPPLLLCHQDGTVQWLQPTGAAIGLVESFQFKTETVPLRPGDVLVLYTDGVTESRNAREQEYGEARLVELVRNKSGSTPIELIRELLRSLNEFTGGQKFADDLTVLIIKIKP